MPRVLLGASWWAQRRGLQAQSAEEARVLRVIQQQHLISPRARELVRPQALPTDLAQPRPQLLEASEASGSAYQRQALGQALPLDLPPAPPRMLRRAP